MNNSIITMARSIFKYTCDEHFFDVINTEEKAYWLGFILADGCIYKNKGHKLSIALKSTDRCHLELFQKHIKSNHPIQDRIHNGNKSCSLIIYNKALVKGLEKQGITTNKSLTAKPSYNIPNNLRHHYIRGILDGDGCVYCYNVKSKKNNKSFLKRGVCFYGTKEVVHYIQQHLNTTKIKKAAGQCLYVVDYGSCKNIVTAINYLYKNSSVALTRKVKMFVAISKSYKQKNQKAMIETLDQDYLKLLRVV